VRLLTLIEEIDVQIDKIQRLIQASAVDDPELAAGLGCTRSMTSIQKDIDEAAVACDALDTQVRIAAGSRPSPS
jgi:hypothetical protein